MIQLNVKGLVSVITMGILALVLTVGCQKKEEPTQEPSETQETILPSPEEAAEAPQEFEEPAIPETTTPAIEGESTGTFEATQEKPSQDESMPISSDDEEDGA